ncbi:MAG: nicotinate-nicotinamide nucleotide adenylyltransferase [Acidobacteriota bacterium]
MGRRIAILGGSFNPPHLGHRKICSHLLAQGFDEVWVVPCYRHPFGKRLAAFKHRLEMCRLMFAGLRAHVLDIERRIGGVSRTVNTLEALRREHPGIRPALVMGSDASRDTGKWLDFERIRKLATIVVIPRPGGSGRGPFLSPLSSTGVRSKLAGGVEVDRDTGRRVARYIRDHHLYGGSYAGPRLPRTVRQTSCTGGAGTTRVSTRRHARA